MRDLAFLPILLCLLYFAVRSSYAGYVLWAWAGLIGLQGVMYGFMSGIAYVQWFAVITLVGVALRWQAGAPRSPHASPGLSVLMLLLALHAVLVAALAYPNLPRNWELATNLLKILLFCLLMPLVVRTRLQSQVLVLIFVLALGVNGLVEGLKFVASGGAHVSRGNARLGDRNYFALYLTVSVPLMVYVLGELRSRLARLVLGAVIGLNVLAILATQSRGGLVALAGVCIWLILRSRRKLLGLTLVAAGAVLVLAYAPERWTDRMQTIGDADEDASFVGRLGAWKRASAIALEHPVFGGGFHSVQADSVFPKYRDRQGLLGFIDTPPTDIPFAAHSIYFETLGDMGFVGLCLFVLIMFAPFHYERRVRRLANSLGPSTRWAADLTAMLTVSMVAYLVGGAALSMAYVDLPYALAMLSATVYGILRRESSAGAAVPGGSARPESNRYAF